jgi:hypothetical protein
MMLLAAALKRSADVSARGVTFAFSFRTVARSGRLFQSLAKRSAPCPQRGHTIDRREDVIAHGGAFKAWVFRAQKRAHRAPSFHVLARS